MSSQLNIYIDKGTDFRLTLELFDDDDDYMDVTNLEFYGSLRKVYSSKVAAELEFEPGPGTIENVDPSSDPQNPTLLIDSITLKLSSDTTSQLKPGKYQYDVIMKKSSGELSKIVEGIAFVVSTITEV